uniref:GCK domain-containing protein n=1 Tax=Opuntia streptacantha TaxID=393608 RepID=A0A7C9CK73_OPUST
MGGNPHNPDLKTVEKQSSEISKQWDKQDEKGVNGGDERKQEGEECQFCVLMKGGGCKDEFIAWQRCIQEAEETKEDAVEKCFDVIVGLSKCVNAHSAYYEGVLRAEKALMEELQHESG